MLALYESKRLHAALRMTQAFSMSRRSACHMPYSLVASPCLWLLPDSCSSDVRCAGDPRSRICIVSPWLRLRLCAALGAGGFNCCWLWCVTANVRCCVLCRCCCCCCCGMLLLLLTLLLLVVMMMMIMIVMVMVMVLFVCCCCCCCYCCCSCWCWR